MRRVLVTSALTGVVILMPADPWVPDVGADLLDRLHRALTRYVVMPTAESADAVVLWIAATHVQQAWQHAARLNIKSPVKRCGKTRLLDVIDATCHKSFVTFNATVSAVVRSIDADDPPTLLIDEADAIWSRNKSGDSAEDLRALVNAGFERNRPVIRCVGRNQTPTAFPSFTMVALAGIGDAVPETITDRSVVVRMRRRAPGETVAPFRHRRDVVPLRGLRDDLHTWLQGHVKALTDAIPDLPVEDRAADVWESLVAVADLAGGPWPVRARAACKVVVDEADDDDADASLAQRLLSDVRDVFSDEIAMHSEDIVARLCQLEEAPWADYFGRPFNVRDLSQKLRRYYVKSKQIKIGDRNRYGFTREQLHDPWLRFLPPGPSKPGTTATRATAATEQVNPVAQQTEVAQPALPADRPLPPDQPSNAGSASSGTPETPAPEMPAGTCNLCGYPLASALIADGEYTHISCLEEAS